MQDCVEKELETQLDDLDQVLWKLNSTPPTTTDDSGRETGTNRNTPNESGTESDSSRYATRNKPWINLVQSQVFL